MPRAWTTQGTFPSGEVWVVEIVLVEMEATHEVVGSLGKWPLCQEASEELGNPATCCWWLCNLQVGDLLFVCRGKRGSGNVRKRRPLILCGDPRR